MCLYRIIEHVHGLSQWQLESCRKCRNILRGPPICAVKPNIGCYGGSTASQISHTVEACIPCSFLPTWTHHQEFRVSNHPPEDPNACVTCDFLTDRNGSMDHCRTRVRPSHEQTFCKAAAIVPAWSSMLVWQFSRSFWMASLIFLPWRA